MSCKVNRFNRRKFYVRKFEENQRKSDSDSDRSASAIQLWLKSWRRARRDSYDRTWKPLEFRWKSLDRQARQRFCRWVLESFNYNDPDGGAKKYDRTQPRLE